MGSRNKATERRHYHDRAIRLPGGHDEPASEPCSTRSCERRAYLRLVRQHQEAWLQAARWELSEASVEGVRERRRDCRKTMEVSNH